MTLFLCGDVVTGRGVDQILPHPSGYQIFEPYVQDAREYVALAEAHNGPIARPVTGSYIWGEALSELARVARHVAEVERRYAGDPATTADAFYEAMARLELSEGVTLCRACGFSSTS